MLTCLSVIIYYQSFWFRLLQVAVRTNWNIEGFVDSYRMNHTLSSWKDTPDDLNSSLVQHNKTSVEWKTRYSKGKIRRMQWPKDSRPNKQCSCKLLKKQLLLHQCWWHNPKLTFSPNIYSTCQTFDRSGLGPISFAKWFLLISKSVSLICFEYTAIW